MKTLFLECNMGAAGDMLLAALLELHPEREAFVDKLNNLGISGVHVKASPSVKCGITGTNISVLIGDEGAEETSIDVDISAHEHAHHHDHEHEHHHHLTGLKDIETILTGLSVSERVKKDVMGVYALIAEAESQAHGRPVSQVHFHEVGNLDAIMDITGVCLLIEELAPRKIVVSPIHVGSGFVRCSHGLLPVPAPATAYILQNVPSYGGRIRGELCTPTGAALLKYFAHDFGPMPLLRVSKIGYGMGKKDFEACNCVRAFLGDTIYSTTGSTTGPNDEVCELSCNIDDMTGEALGFTCRSLLSEGALDVYTTSIDMKKDRPGTMLNCICKTEKADFFAALMLKLSSSFGVRKAIYSRYILERKTEEVQTDLGKIRLKTGTGFGIIKNKPEYEDIAVLAKEHNISIGEAERRIWAQINRGELHDTKK
ncbi:MAG: nickel pincer cofactor biosynthesis protein LarC [Treponema sp.]|nr:nickel pincer cofactor biosynthesis protein LarC [Treponema sp.]